MLAMMQRAIKDGFGEFLIVQYFSPQAEWFVGREQDRTSFEIALIHNLKQDIGSVIATAEIANFITDQHMRVYEGFQGGGKISGIGQLLDQGRGRDKASAKASL
jgi:hypothetical protein